MHVDEGEDRANGRDGGGRPERIGIGGGDDAVTRIQLAARWAESFAPEHGDTLVASLKRFRLAYDYLDSVIHGVEPNEPEQGERRAPAAAAAQPSSYAPPSAEPPAAPPSTPLPPESEPRPWG